MNTPLVSVIVPVYNVEKTLARCLESICGQSYQNLEIIVVNDGSPDGSLAICEQFRAKDPRVVVISKENEGLSLTRNAGMRAAHGSICSSWTAMIILNPPLPPAWWKPPRRTMPIWSLHPIGW